MHGKQSKIQIDSSLPLFQGLPEIIPAARYHSLILEGESIPEVLTVAAEDDEGQIMAVKHLSLIHICGMRNCDRKRH